MATIRYGFSIEEMKDRVIGRRWHPGFGRISKPDFSLARARLNFQGIQEILMVVVVVGGVVTPGLLCCGFLSWNRGPMGQGGRRTAPGPGPVTTPPEGAAQGPRARLASPILAGKGIAQGQLFTVKESPFLPAQQVLTLAR